MGSETKLVGCRSQRHRAVAPDFRGRCRRLHRAVEAAGDVAGDLHRAGRPRACAGSLSPGTGIHLDPLHRGRRRRLGRAEHVVRKRHRRQDDAHRQPSDPAWTHHPAGSADVRHDAAFFSVMTLGILVNWFAGALLAFTIFFYVVIYTIALKRWTAQNIVIGGAAGALPPVVAWAAATGSLSVEPLLLFLIIFFWTPPHFWALALFRSDEYARAGVPMLPVVAGPDATRLQILLYTVVLVAIAFAPWPLGYFDAVYGVTSLILGAGMLALAIDVYRRRERSPALRASRKLFAFSIFYLFALFATWLMEVVARAIAPSIW